ncbi:unnamed protein product [Didymodactylos carnosus]|uniref:Uncharacterized protein n=1 Tax=Didymodactylos carnosus TaxID=1234261 RepID=A0A815EEW2_9BILA|nr:unnamed protein product [Didymodactylos carnosus]CAF4145661.1 unnamed protein product [Didymodactylos carnosus]
MAPYTFTLFAPYNKSAGLRLKNANSRMFGIDIPMEKNEEDGYFRVTTDLADDGQEGTETRFFSEEEKNAKNLKTGRSPAGLKTFLDW